MIFFHGLDNLGTIAPDPGRVDPGNIHAGTVRSMLASVQLEEEVANFFQTLLQKVPEFHVCAILVHADSSSDCGAA